MFNIHLFVSGLLVIMAVLAVVWVRENKLFGPLFTKETYFWDRFGKRSPVSRWKHNPKPKEVKE